MPGSRRTWVWMICKICHQSFVLREKNVIVAFHRPSSPTVKDFKVEMVPSFSCSLDLLCCLILARIQGCGLVSSSVGTWLPGSSNWQWCQFCFWTRGSHEGSPHLCIYQNNLVLMCQRRPRVVRKQIPSRDWKPRVWCWLGQWSASVWTAVSDKSAC